MSRPIALVEIGGITSPENQRDVESAFEDSGLRESRRQLLLGSRATYESQVRGTQSMPGRVGCPTGDTISYVMRPNTEETPNPSLKVAQVDFSSWFSIEDSKKVVSFVDLVMRRTKSWADGVQFVNPPAAEYERALMLAKAAKKRYNLGTTIVEFSTGNVRSAGVNGLIGAMEKHPDAVNYAFLNEDAHGPDATPDLLEHFLNSGYASPELSKVGFGIVVTPETIAKHGLHFKDIIRTFPEASFGINARFSGRHADEAFDFLANLQAVTPR